MIFTIVVNMLVFADDSAVEAAFQKLVRHVALPPFKYAPKIRSQKVIRNGGCIEVDAGSFLFWCLPSGRVRGISNGWASGENRYFEPSEVLSPDQLAVSFEKFLAVSGNEDLRFRLQSRDNYLALGPNGELPSVTTLEAQVYVADIPLAGYNLSVSIARKTGQVTQFSGLDQEPPLPPRSLKPAVGPESAEGTSLARFAKWFPECSPTEIHTGLAIFADVLEEKHFKSKWYENYVTETRMKDFDDGRGVLVWTSSVRGSNGSSVGSAIDAITGQVLWVAGQDGSGGFGGGGKLVAPAISYGKGTWSVTVAGKTKKVWADLQPVRFVPAKKNSPNMLLRRGKLLFRLNPTGKPNVYTDTASKLSYRLSGPKSTG